MPAFLLILTLQLNYHNFICNNRNARYILNFNVSVVRVVKSYHSSSYIINLVMVYCFNIYEVSIPCRIYGNLGIRQWDTVHQPPKYIDSTDRVFSTPADGLLSSFNIYADSSDRLLFLGSFLANKDRKGLYLIIKQIILQYG